jgi:hypothetical protein
MTPWRLLFWSVGLSAIACGPASKPPVDTQQTLPPAAPPADLSRHPATTSADAGKPEQKPNDAETRPEN